MGIKKCFIKYKYLILFVLVVIVIFLLYLYNYYNNYLIFKNNIDLELTLKKQKEINEYKQKVSIRKDFLENLDFNSDSSITKFVSSQISFNKKDYIPKNLVSISTWYIIDLKWWNQKLRKEALIALKKMADAYFRETGEKIIVVSAYRSYLYQKGIKDRGCPDNLCAKAWFSEHQTGLTVDLWAATSLRDWQKEPFLSRYKWLKNNAYKYGFHNTYQKWLEIDTYEIEPWHWRYLWKSLAKYLWEKNLTFAEFYKEMEQY